MKKQHLYYLNCEKPRELINRHIYYLNGAEPGSSGGWKGKPESWPDIRKHLIPNSIRLLADNRYPLGFTADATGGYTVKIDGEVKGTYASGAQCSIPQTDWPKGHINSLTAYGATEQSGTPTPTVPVDIVSNNGALKYSANMANVNAQTALVGYYTSAQGVVTKDMYNWMYQNFIPVKPNTTYTLSMSSAVYFVSISEYATAQDSGFVVRKAGGTGANTQLTITTGATTNFVRFGTNIDRTEVTLEEVLAINWMLNEGGTALPYAPYSQNGIYTDGTVETIKAHAKNLFDKNSYTEINAYVNSNTGALTQGSPGTLTQYCAVIPCLPNTTYTISGRANSAWGAFTSINIGTIATSYSKTENVSITTGANDKYLIGLVRANQGVIDYRNTLQVELGSTATDYEPYFNGGTATAEMLLKVANYQDVQSIIDGVVTRNIGVKVLDGTENWQNLSGYFNLSKTDLGSDSTVMPSNSHNIICSHFETKDGTFTDGIGIGGNYVNFKYDSIATTLANWKTWLATQYTAGTPVIIVYPLATPTTETVTPQALTGTTATVTAGSISDLQITYTQSSGGYPIDYPTGAESAHIVDIYPTTEGNNITSFKCQRVAASGNEQQGVLWVHFNLNNVINISSLLNNDSNNLSGSLCEAVTAKNNKITCSGAYCSFKQAFDLGYVPILEADTNEPKNLYQLLQYNSKLKDVTLKNFRNKNDTTGGVSYGMFQGSNIENIKGNWICTPCSEMFYNCKKLKKLPLIDASQSKVMKDFLTNAIALEDTVLDVRDAIGLKKIGCYGTSQYFMSGFKGLRVSNQAPFSESAPQINVSYTGMDRTALVQLFNDLPTVSAGQIINITGCTGADDLTADDKAIATAKGWTVTL